MPNALKADRLEATVNDPRWTLVVKHDKGADGRFFFSVATTGIYCRPSCRSRLPNPENVQFHDTREDAERAGFRPCKRCQPNLSSPGDALKDKIVEACRILENSETEPTLAELADQVAMSSFHFHRLFKIATGLTPKQYANAHREQRLREDLRRGSTVTQAIFQSGYRSSSRFYEKSKEVLGMTATSFRAGGHQAKIVFSHGRCQPGFVLVAQSEVGICAILLGDDPFELERDLQRRFPVADLTKGDGEFDRLVAQVVAFVEKPEIGLDLPLDIRGTAFQKRVWETLRQIPAGVTASYTEIAKKMGSPKSVRAVAQACGANSLAVAIPCHRVVRNNGDLSGYRWGVERKRELLKRESKKA